MLVGRYLLRTPKEDIWVVSGFEMVNKTALNIPIKSLCGHIFPFHLKGKIPASEWDGLFLWGYQLFKKLSNCFLKWLYYFTLPPAMNESPLWLVCDLSFIFLMVKSQSF